MRAFQKREQFCRSAVPAAWVPVSSPEELMSLRLAPKGGLCSVHYLFRAPYLAATFWVLPNGSKDRGTFLEFAGFQHPGQAMALGASYYLPPEESLS